MIRATSSASRIATNAFALIGCAARDPCTADCLADLHFFSAVENQAKSQNEPNRGCHSMTSFSQIDANRRNALKSTGPSTAEGKERWRCNAVCHRLTAATVI